MQAADEHVLYDYSVVECETNSLQPGESSRMTSIIEKPDRDIQFKSNYSAVGRYVLSADIWPLLEKTEPGAWGRIQLTDAIAELLKHKPVEAMELVGSPLTAVKKWVIYGHLSPIACAIRLKARRFVRGQHSFHYYKYLKFFC